jgi:hypothetical protein
VVNPAAADATGTQFVKAGEDFSVTVTALTSTGGNAHSYGKESPAETVKLTSSKAPLLGLTNDPALSFTAPAFGSFTNGVASGTRFNWKEVGIITLVPSVGDGSYLDAGDTQCNPDPTIVPAYGGATACPPSGNVGRFYAAKFALTNNAIGNRADLVTGSMTAGNATLTLASNVGVKVGDVVNVAGAGTAGIAFASTALAVSANGLTVTLAASAATTVASAPVYLGAFTYIGEPIDALFTLTAKDVDGTATLQNYNYSATAANNFAKLNPLAAVTTGTGGPLGVGAVDAAATRTPLLPCAATPAQPCLTPATATAGTFVAGVANVRVPFTIYRDTLVPRGPYSSLKVGVAPQDSDGAILAYDLDTVNLVSATGSENHALIGSTKSLYGRIAMQNMYGSERLALAVPIQAQYWNGSSFISNPDDGTTPVPKLLATTVVPAGAPGLYFYTISAKNLLLPADAVPVLCTTTGSPTGACGTAGSPTTALNGGKAKLQFPVPNNHPGWLDVILSVPSYLQYNWGNCGGQGTDSLMNDLPCARATFGVYKSPIIYRRENY